MGAALSSVEHRLAESLVREDRLRNGRQDAIKQQPLQGMLSLRPRCALRRPLTASRGEPRVSRRASVFDRALRVVAGRVSPDDWGEVLISKSAIHPIGATGGLADASAVEVATRVLGRLPMLRRLGVIADGIILATGLLMTVAGLFALLTHA